MMWNCRQDVQVSRAKLSLEDGDGPEVEVKEGVDWIPSCCGAVSKPAGISVDELHAFLEKRRQVSSKEESTGSSSTSEGRISK